MKRYVILPLLLIVTMFVSLVSADEIKTRKVLCVGNSFSWSLDRYFKQVTESAGCRLELTHLSIGGCSLERHWMNIAKEIENPEKPAHFNYTYLSKIQSQEWDFISVQQASHFSWKAETYQPYGNNLVKFLQENSPSAEVMVQQTWAYHPAEKRLIGWKISQHDMYEALTVAYNTFAEENNLRVIPTGDAVQLARDTQPGGYNPNDKERVFTADGFHLNARGQYLQACVWFGVLFDEPVSKVTFQPKELTAEDATFLREVAQKAIDARK